MIETFKKNLERIILSNKPHDEIKKNLLTDVDRYITRLAQGKKLNEYKKSLLILLHPDKFGQSNGLSRECGDKLRQMQLDGIVFDFLMEKLANPTVSLSQFESSNPVNNQPPQWQGKSYQDLFADLQKYGNQYKDYLDRHRCPPLLTNIIDGYTHLNRLTDNYPKWINYLMIKPIKLLAYVSLGFSLTMTFMVSCCIPLFISLLGHFLIDNSMSFLKKHDENSNDKTKCFYDGHYSFINGMELLDDSLMYSTPIMLGLVMPQFDYNRLIQLFWHHMSKPLPENGKGRAIALKSSLFIGAVIATPLLIVLKLCGLLSILLSFLVTGVQMTAYSIIHGVLALPYLLYSSISKDSPPPAATPAPANGEHFFSSKSADTGEKQNPDLRASPIPTQ